MQNQILQCKLRKEFNQENLGQAADNQSKVNELLNANTNKEKEQHDTERVILQDLFSIQNNKLKTINEGGLSIEQAYHIDSGTNPIIKEKIIVSEEKEDIGLEWLTCVSIQFFYDISQIAFNYQKNYWIKRLGYIWKLVCYSLFLVYYVKDQLNSSMTIADFMYLINILQIGTCAIQLLTIGLDIFLIWVKNIDDNYPLLPKSSVIWCFFLIPTGFVIMNYIRHNKWTAWVILAETLIIEPILTFNIILWVALIPLGMVAIIFELLIRMIIGKYDCQTERNKVYVYKYLLFKYNSQDFPENELCSICLQKFKSTDDNICVLNCRKPHVFHENCIFDWILIQAICPICRAAIQFKQ